MFSRKKDKEIENLKKINKELEEKAERQDFEISRLNSELKNQKKIAFELNEEILGYRQERTALFETIKDSAKTIKSLKSLCTRNNVNYKHLFKRGS